MGRKKSPAKCKNCGAWAGYAVPARDRNGEYLCYYAMIKTGAEDECKAGVYRDGGGT